MAEKESGFLLIAFIVLLVALLATTINSINKKTEKVIKETEFCQDIDLEIVDSCYNNQDKTLEITLENKKDTMFSEAIDFRLEGDEIFLLPAPPNTKIEPFGIEKISLSFDNNISKILLMPKGQSKETGKAIYCQNQVKTFNFNNKNCPNL